MNLLVFCKAYSLILTNLSTMRKHLYMILTMVLCVPFFNSCYDDTQIWDAIDDHESRIAYLEDQCEQINVNIASIQYLLKSQVNGDYIVSIKPYLENGKEVGYVITFYRRGSIVIYHGKNGADGEIGMPGVPGEDGEDGEDGKDGENGKDGEDGKDGKDGKDGEDGLTPIIGVKKDSDGIYYWTVNGEWLLGENGEKIKAIGSDGASGDDGKPGEDGKDGIDGEDGATPVIGVKKDSDGIYYWTVNGEWLLGENGEKIKAVGQSGESGGLENASCIFSNVEETDEGYVNFTLADGTLIQVPTWEFLYSHNSFSITFSQTDFVVGDIQELDIPFELTGTIGTTEIDAIVLSRDDAQSAEIEMVGETNGVLHITTGWYNNLDVLVIASNNGRTTHKLITIREGELYIYDYAEISGLGGTMEVPVTTNFDYEVVIPDEYSHWIHFTDIETKSELREECIILSVSQNTEEYERYGEIELRDKQFGSLLARVYIYQMPLELRLSVDRTQLEADGRDSVVLTVESGWSMITEGVEFYNDQNEIIDIEDFCFKTTTAGSYSIYAKYEGIVSNTIYLLAKDENTPEYIAVYGEIGSDNIECAVLGLDGSVMYYHKNDSIPEVINKISRFNNYTNEVEYIVNFDENGNVSSILTPDVTVVLSNYRDNYFDAMIFTSYGERIIIRDIEYGDAPRMMTKSPSGIEMANLAISGVTTGLELAAIASVGVAAAGPVSIAMAAIGIGCLAYDAATAFDLIEEGPVWGELTANLVGFYGGFIEMGIKPPTNKLEIAAALAQIAAHCMGLAEIMEGDANHKIIIGEGTLNPSGCISATLTWSGPADIDLHCSGPSGHIYYQNMSAGSGYLDNDNTSANGPETIYYSNPQAGSYSFYIHYYAENSGVSSVNYSVTVNFFGEKEEFTGTISGQGSTVPIKTVLVGGISNTRSVSCEHDNYVIDWNNLPKKVIRY